MIRFKFANGVQEIRIRTSTLLTMAIIQPEAERSVISALKSVMFVSEHQVLQREVPRRQPTICRKWCLTGAGQ